MSDRRDLVIDASVAFKWYAPEPGHEIAEGLLVQAETNAVRLLAPDFMLIEVANIGCKRFQQGQMRSTAVERVLTTLRLLPVGWRDTMEYLDLATALAMSRGCTVYDALYLAVAEAYDAVLVTADSRLCEKAREGGLAGRVRLLRDFAL